MSRHRQRKQHTAIVLPASLHDNQVLTLRQWCSLAGISLRTGRRAIASGCGPTIVRLSERRVGVTVGAHRQWLAERERTSPNL
jgi:hypothetical protein